MSVILILFLVTFLSAAFYFKDDILSILKLTPPTTPPTTPPSGGGDGGGGEGGGGEGGGDGDGADGDGDGADGDGGDGDGDGADGDGADGDGADGDGDGASGDGDGGDGDGGDGASGDGGPDISCLTVASCSSPVDDAIICAGSVALTYLNPHNPRDWEVGDFQNNCNHHCPAIGEPLSRKNFDRRAKVTPMPAFTC